MKRSSLILILCFFIYNGNAQIVINELMAKNDTTITDPDFNDHSDWVELYNLGPDSVDILGYFLSDNKNIPYKWQVQQSFLMAPNQYLLIWCDDKDTLLHTNFKLSGGGEAIQLVSKDSVVLDSLTFGQQIDDISYARKPNGTGSFVQSQPSPGNSNDASQTFNEIAEPPTFSHKSGFYNDAFEVMILGNSNENTVIRYTLDNSEPTENSPIYTSALQVVDRNNENNFYSKIKTTSVNRFPAFLDFFPWLPPFEQPEEKVAKATVIRAKIFEEDKLPSKTITKTYFVEDGIAQKYENIPVISLVTEPDNLFDYRDGIYVPGITYDTIRFLGLRINGYGNYLADDLKRPANIEYFENSLTEAAFNADVTIWTQGSTSPANPQKSLHIKVENSNGKNYIDYPFFEGRNYRASSRNNYNRFILRAWGGKGQVDLFSDAAGQSLLQHTDQNIQAYRPVVVFIDGEYWGIQEIRENNKTASYYKENHNVDEENLTLIYGSKGEEEVKYGDMVDWNNLILFLEEEDVSNETIYDSIQKLIDIPHFIEYIAHTIYTTRKDWPYQNEGKWKAKGGKWKMVTYDMDGSFGYDAGPTYDMIDHTINGSLVSEPHPIFKQLVQNQNFIDAFTNKMCDLMNTVLSTEYIDTFRNELAAELRPYHREFKERWNFVRRWEWQLNSIRSSYTQRPPHVRQHIEDHFDYNILHKVNLDVNHTDAGYIQLHDMHLKEGFPTYAEEMYPWSGEYYEDLPIRIKAIPKAGHHFVAWKNSANEIVSENQEILASLISDTTFVAVFEIGGSPVSGVFINELLASNDNDITDENGEHEDWIELFNASSETVDIKGLFLTDDRSELTKWEIPGIHNGDLEFNLEGSGFTFFWADDDEEDGPLHTNFKLSAGGEFIALVQVIGSDTFMIDSLSFGSQTTDVSFGRYEDGSHNLEAFITTTPGASNLQNSPQPLVTNLHINEFMADNDTFIHDEFDEFDDWIEIYNANDSAVTLEGLYLSDDINDPTKWLLVNDEEGELVIESNGYLLLWADGTPEQGIKHVDFKLSSGGEQISLVQLHGNDTIFIDSLSYGQQFTDTSYGCFPDGSDSSVYFTQSPTPNSTNIKDMIVGIAEITNHDFKIYPNPTNGFIEIEFETVDAIKSIFVTDLTGKIKEQNSIISKVSKLDLSSYVSGLYIINVTYKDGKNHYSRVLKL